MVGWNEALRTNLDRKLIVAAQHGHRADAAVRPQDRRHFETQIQPDRPPDLQGGAAHAQAVGRP